MIKSEAHQIPLRIRRCYLLQIEHGEKTTEYRPDTPYWRSRLERYLDPDLTKAAAKALEGNLIATFICRKDLHRRIVVLITRIPTPGFSSQGRSDVPTPKCFAIDLGREIKWCECRCGCEYEVDNLMEDRCDSCNELHDYND